MPDMYFDVDTAIAECPVNVLPLLDATDFKTIEDAVAYNAAGMALYWHFCTSAGAYTVTAVTPTTAGNYDWTDQGAAGIYTIEIPASGGASINNDTEGYGWFTGSATGVLPWRGPVIGFRAAAINDALCDGGDNLDVNTVQWLGTACATPTVAGVPEVDLTHVAGATTNVSTLATNVDAILTDTADMQPKLGTPAGASISADLMAIDNFVDGLESTIGAAGAGLTAIPPVTLANSVTHGGTAAVLSISQLLITAGDGNPNILLTGSGAAAGMSFTRSGGGGVFDTSFAAALQQEAADALTAYDPPTNAEMVARTIVSADYATATAVADLPTNAELATALGTADDAVLAQVALVKAKTDSLTFTVAGQIDANIKSINDVTITGDGGATPFNV